MKNKEYTSFLEEDVNAAYQEKANKNKKQSSVLSKQTKLIVILAAFIVVMIPVYIFFVIPMLEKSVTTTPVTEEKLPLSYNEVYHTNGSIAMMPSLTEDQLSKVTIKNKANVRNDEGQFVPTYNEWSIFKGASGSWAIEGYNSISYDASALVTILATYINMEITDKMEYESFSEINLEAFGFDEKSMPCSYTIKTTDGKEYVVTMGNETPTAKGYYAYFTDENGEKRPTVYIISSFYASLINCSMYELVSPVIIQMLDQQNYMPSTFSLYRGINQYFNIKKYSTEELQESESGKVSRLFIEIDGVKYEYDASAYYSVLFYDTIRPGIDGTKVVYAKPDSDKNMSKDVLLSYGIDTSDPYRQLFFRAYTTFATGTSHEMDHMLVFSAPTKNEAGDDIYYVFNVAFNTIVEVGTSTFDFIEKDYTEFCEKYIVLFPFYNIDEITIDSTTLPDVYVQSGMKSLLETFIIKSTTEYKLENAFIKSTGKEVSAVKGTKISGIENFGEWYSVLLSLSTQTEIPEGVLDKIDLDKPDITVTMKTVGGKTHVMRFYLYNSRHAYYTFNGLGRAYVKYSDITNMLESTYRLMNGQQVNVGYTAKPDPTVTPSDTVTPPETENEGGVSPLVTALVVILAIVVAAGGGVVAYVIIKNKRRGVERK